MFCIKCGNEIKENSQFCIKCGLKIEPDFSKKERKNFSIKRRMIFAAFIILGIILILASQNFNKEEINPDVTSVVVNIYCEDKINGESYGGSGTIFSKDGLILTNAHIIPESAYDDVYVDDTYCIVTLPNPETGLPDEIYYAYPILIPELSDQYDLAFMQIHDVFYNYEEGVAYGEYPKDFPILIDKSQCGDDYIKLGEEIRVYGYPSLSGGYALTVTDGVVSSMLVDEGLIITSAKISFGNSGGLAVDKNGCMIGVPSRVLSDENESFGVIISNNTINTFFQLIDERNLLK